MGKVLVPGFSKNTRQTWLSPRKILALLTTMIATVILTACGSPTSAVTTPSSVPASPKTSVAATTAAIPSSTAAASSVAAAPAATTAAKPAGGGAGGAPPPAAGGTGGAQPPPGGGPGVAQPPPAGGAGGAQPPAGAGGGAPKPPGGLPANKKVGLMYKDAKAFNGYTLFAPNFSNSTYLIDMDGNLVHTWESTYIPGQSVYLLEGGTLVRSTHYSDAGPGPTGGGVQKIAWDGTMLWDFKYLSKTYIPHHDIRPLPNGNVLLICWDIKTREEALAAGRKKDLIAEGSVWSEKIVEIKPDGKTGGTVVWEWRLWDHLVQSNDSTKDNFGVIADHPELVDINFAMGGKADWVHANAVDYNAKLDQILISCHEQSEVWIIDHSTTAQEVATHSGGKVGKGGDLIYRWGNPRGYGAGVAADQKLFAPHNIQWIESGLPGEGNILIFNNGNVRPGGNYSSVDEIVTPVDAQGRYALTKGAAYGPAAQTWIYKAKTPTEFFAEKISGAQRQPNGNTLVCHGPLGTFFEVTKEGDIVWEYVCPVAGGTFRANRFAADSPALKGLNLAVGNLLEATNPKAAPGAAAAAPAPAGSAAPAAGTIPTSVVNTGKAPPAKPASSGKLVVNSSVVKEAGNMPDKYTRTGAKAGLTTVSPPITWSGAPAGTQSFAVIGSGIANDGNEEIHWIMYNIPGATASLAEDVKGVGAVGQTFVTPSEGAAGTYKKTLTVYALSANITVADADKADVTKVRAAMEGKVLDTGSLNYEFTVG